MGLFISNCKGCGKPITWFCISFNYDCQDCGSSMSAEEVEKSWEDNYFRHRVQSVKEQLQRGIDIEEISRYTDPEYFEKIMNTISKEKE